MAKTKKTAVERADKLKLYERVVAALPGVERKGAKMPYTSLNGHMFSFLAEDGTLALRLPDDDREAFLKNYKTTLCEQHGRIMKEYVVIPDALLKKPQDLTAAFRTSVAYIGSLKPKATTKKKTPSKPKPKKKAVKKSVPKKKPKRAKKRTTEQ